MACLSDEVQPLVVRDQSEENKDELTPSIKIEMYKEIHGSYTPKDVLIKKLNALV
jgi:hypothetical protein